MSTRPNFWTLGAVVLVGFGLGWGTVLLAKELGLTVGMVALTFGGTLKLAEDMRRAKAQRILAALKDTGLTLKEAADLCEADLSDFHKSITDPARRCDLYRLEIIGPEFVGNLALRDLDFYGLPRMAKMALRIAPHLAKETA